MSRRYYPVAFTDDVVAAQERYGSRSALDRLSRTTARSGAPRNGSSPDRWDGTDPEGLPGDPLSADERWFLEQLDGFYLATVSQTGWPYLQYRGGPTGFVRTPDEHTISWAEFRGNRQYISTGNLAHDSRVALIFMDYPRRLRLKVFGRARLEERPNGPAVDALGDYRAKVERQVHIDVVAYDWNCQQHITPRFTVEGLAPLIQPLRDRVDALEAENARLRAAPGPAPRSPEGTGGVPGPEGSVEC